MKPSDYPPGYGVADPPGFCVVGCNCMDDARLQSAAEITKGWLKDPEHDKNAEACIDALDRDIEALGGRRRGRMYKQHHFEMSGNRSGNQLQSRAALELAGLVERAVADVVRQIPLHGLQDSPVRIPAVAFLATDRDYEPIRAGGVLPAWASCGRDDGRLSVTTPPAAMDSGAGACRIEFGHLFEADPAGTVACNV